MVATDDKINRIIRAADEKKSKRDIGLRIAAYLNRFSEIEQEELKNALNGCRDTTLDNIIKGRAFPKIPMLVDLANRSNIPMCSFIDDNYTNIRAQRRYMLLIHELDIKSKIKLLLRCWCEKYDMLQMYDKDCIEAIFDEDKNMSSTLVGYMLKLQRVKNGISRTKMSQLLGNGANSVANAERGNNFYSFITTLNMSKYVDSPIDFFYAGQLKNKDLIIEYMLDDIFKDTTRTDEKFFMDYLMLYKGRVL